MRDAGKRRRRKQDAHIATSTGTDRISLPDTL
jgi:hypothetical protein